MHAQNRFIQALKAILALIFFNAAYTDVAVGGSSVSLPTPTGLGEDVGFWEKVFSSVTPDQCMFHDKNDLSMVYFVKQLPGQTRAQQARAGRRYLNAIKRGMQHLGNGGRPRNLVERRIVQVTPATKREPHHYRSLVNQVRCQRGVDLAPSLKRSRQYLPMIRRLLAQKKLPSDLAYLPHLESGFHAKAHSHAGARGLWQLMPATARLMGMRVHRRNDQRIDPYKATTIAVELLNDLYAKTKNWPLAITGYNYGINGISRAIKAYGNDYLAVRSKHRTRLFGFAARNYYPSFLAVRNVAMDYERHDDRAGERVSDAKRKSETRLAF